MVRLMVNRARRSNAISIVAPIGGLNDKDSIADMPAKDALILDNWFPGTQSVDVRGGSSEFATGAPAVIETLMVYNGIANNKIAAVANGSIYDITAGGTFPAAALSGMSNSRFDWVNFANSGASYLVAVNGADLPRFYNGTSWTFSGLTYAPAITGVAATTFSQVNVWKNRLFFVQKNTLSCWYLGTGAIGGAAAELNFGGVAKLGGALIATATITTSAGTTPDDYFVAITSEGECLVYRGTDPTSITTFFLVGNYRIGRPIANGIDNQGGRWLAKLGSDIVAITADGFTTLQDMLNNDVVASQRTINGKIINSVTTAVSRWSSNFGWQILLCPFQNKLFVNVPTSEGTQAYQYVMNTITGAWTRFQGWNATCFAYSKDKIYAAIGTKVYQVDLARSNDFVTSTYTGDVINATAKTAFMYLGGRNKLKSYKMVRPLLLAGGDPSPLVNINVNLEDKPIVGVASVSTSSSASRWDTALWDITGIWVADEGYFQNWVSVSGLGYSVALKIQIQTDNNKCRWLGWDAMYEAGGLI